MHVTATLRFRACILTHLLVALPNLKAFLLFYRPFWTRAVIFKAKPYIHIQWGNILSRKALACGRASCMEKTLNTKAIYKAIYIYSGFLPKYE